MNVDDYSDLWLSPGPSKYAIVEFDGRWLVCNHVERSLVLIEAPQEILDEIRSRMLQHGARVLSRADLDAVVE